LRYGNIRSRIAEHDAIERVKGFEPDFEIEPFFNRKDLRKAEVLIQINRAAQVRQIDASGSIADRDGEGVEVEIAIRGRIERSVPGSSLLNAENGCRVVRASEVGQALLGRDADQGAGAAGKNAIEMPSRR
jgi:hypothetical protein